MSSADWVPELAVALDRLVPLDDGSRGDWHDVVARVGGRRRLKLGRRQPRRSVRLAIVVALLFLLLTGAATATYLLIRNGNIAIGVQGRLLVVNPNGPGLRVISGCAVSRPSCTVSGATWSPDGTRLAFVRGGDVGLDKRSPSSLYVAAADGQDAIRVTSCGTRCVFGIGLGWSPDSRWIVLSRAAGREESLWVIAAAGGRPHRLTHCSAPCADNQAAWSPDGHLLAFIRSARTARASGLYTIRPDASGLTRIASGWGDPQWSPNGRRIVFDSSPDTIAVVDADGSHVHVLLAGARGTGPGAPSWSPDGRKLVFFKTPGRPRYRAEVWTMNADGSDKKRLYGSGCCVSLWAAPIWSPDGRMIAFSADSAGGTFVINADGTGLRRLSRSVSESLSWQRRPQR